MLLYSTVCVHCKYIHAVTADKVHVLLRVTCHCSSGSTDNLNHKSFMHLCMICFCMRIDFVKIGFFNFQLHCVLLINIGLMKICQIGVHIVTSFQKQYI